MTDPRLILGGLTFTGSKVEPVKLGFSRGLNILYGASNTGKSFTLKVLDFMLGGSRDLPDIEQRRAYERAWLAIDLPKPERQHSRVRWPAAPLNFMLAM